jgi:hypothetical protein
LRTTFNDLLDVVHVIVVVVWSTFVRDNLISRGQSGHRYANRRAGHDVLYAGAASDREVKNAVVAVILSATNNDCAVAGWQMPNDRASRRVMRDAPVPQVLALYTGPNVVRTIPVPLSVADRSMAGLMLARPGYVSSGAGAMSRFAARALLVLGPLSFLLLGVSCSDDQQGG